MATATRPLTDNQFRILTAIAEGDGLGYAYALASGLDIPLGTVRKALLTLRRGGYLKSDLRYSPVGPARRSFTLSAAGARALA